MGPMRIPYSITDKSDNSTLECTEHAMTYQLADWLNELNHNDPDLKANFILWIQHSENELLARGTGRHPDGSIPTRGEIAVNASLGTKPTLLSAEYNSTKEKMNAILKNQETLKLIQRDPWRAHKKFINEGYDDVSQQSFMKNTLMASENVTDAITTASDYDIFWDEMVHNSNLAQDGSSTALGLTQWKCVDGGFNRLSDAFLPRVSNRLTINRKITSLEPTTSQNASSVARPAKSVSASNQPAKSPSYSAAVSGKPIRNKPIFGGYSQPDSFAIGALYYPIYGLNGTDRPGAIIHYRGGDWSDKFVPLPDEVYADMVLDAIVSLRGEQARELYTGKYEKLCCLEDEFSATSWARPDIMQHKLYIPSYHTTEHNTIFIGEHTAPTHSWVSSALISAVRGTVQLLLELGMVDEAKEINQKWTGRWIGLDG